MRSRSFSTPRGTKRRFSRLFFVIFLILMLSIVVLILSFLANRLLRFQNLVCHYANQECPTIILDQLAVYQKQFFFALPRNRVIKDLESTGLVSKIDFKIRPGTLEVFLTPAVTDIYLQSVFTSPEPTFSFLSEATSSSVLSPTEEVNSYLATQSAQSHALSNNGTLNPSDQKSSIYLIGVSLPNRETLLRIADWLKSLQLFNFQNTSTIFLSQTIVVVGPNQPTLLFSLPKDPNQSLSALPNLLNLATINNVNLLDFRFNHPILKTHGKSR